MCEPSAQLHCLMSEKKDLLTESRNFVEIVAIEVKRRDACSFLCVHGFSPHTGISRSIVDSKMCVPFDGLLTCTCICPVIGSISYKAGKIKNGNMLFS